MNNNIATVNSIYEAFGMEDIPSIIDHLANNVQWEHWSDNSAQKAGVPWLQARTGKEGALEFFRIVGELGIKESFAYYRLWVMRTR